VTAARTTIVAPPWHL